MKSVKFVFVSLLVAGCQSSEEAYREAEERFRQETEVLASLKRERDTLVLEHEQRLRSHTDVKMTEFLERGHRLDLATMNQVIERQRHHLDWVKANRDEISNRTQRP